MDSKAYWDNKIIEWEDSMKGQGSLSFIEKLAAYFRKPLKFRSAMSLELVKPFVKEKTVLELGSASGYFAFELLEKGQPKKITGVDISKNAVARANQLAKEKGLENRCAFREADAANFYLPEADITIGLGFLDYLSPEEIRRLFHNIKSKYFLFTFSEKKFCLLRLIHIFYLLSQKCPKHFYYTKQEITNCIGDGHGGIQFLNHPKMSFGCIVYNLPQ